MDVILIQAGRAHEVFRGSNLADMKGRFTDDLLGNMVEVPTGSVDVGYIWDGRTFARPTPAPIDELKSFYLRAVNDEAEKVRLRYVTPGSAKSQVYQEKFAQAQGAMADDIDTMSEFDLAAQFPLIYAMIGIHGETFCECRDIVLKKASEWVMVASQIEAIADRAKQAIRAAEEHDEVSSLFNAIEWPKS